QWELLNLEGIQGDRGTKWTSEIKRVAAEMKSFYKRLSERIHNAYAVGDYVEWHRSALTSVQNEAVEYV
ncbi:12670_t:CDS:2, partial [Ambispora gerdemannii]